MACLTLLRKLLFPTNRELMQLAHMFPPRDKIPKHMDLVLWCFPVLLVAILVFVVFGP
ncbi:hypothetical protein ABIA94_009176 [Bradyrhizobium sp. LA7.1]